MDDREKVWKDVRIISRKQVRRMVREIVG